MCVVFCKHLNISEMIGFVKTSSSMHLYSRIILEIPEIKIDTDALVSDEVRIVSVK